MSELQLLPRQLSICNAVLEQLNKHKLVELKMPYGFGRMFITGAIIQNKYKKVIICSSYNSYLIDAKSTLTKTCPGFDMDTTKGEKWIAFCLSSKFDRNDYPECELFVGVNLIYTLGCFPNTLLIEYGQKCKVNEVEIK